MPKSNSFVKINKISLKALCEETIAKIKKEREKRETKYVLEQIKSRNWWLRRLLGKKNFTFDEMKAQIEYEVKSPGFGDDKFVHLCDYPSIYGWGTLDIIEKLIKSCNCSAVEDTIWASVEDLDRLV